MFERLVVEVLRFYLKESKQPFEKIPKFDGYAPNGIHEIKGPTAIEVKYNLNRTPVSLIRNNLIKLGTKNLKNILLISNTQIGESKRRIVKKYIEIDLGIEVFLWTRDDIIKIANKIGYDYRSRERNIFKIHTQSEDEENSSGNVSNFNKNRKNKKIIKSLKKHIQNNGDISLFIGAGVSASAGMPDWDSLLKELIFSYFSKTLSEKISDDTNLKRVADNFDNIDSSTALSLARYLRTGFDRYSKSEENLFRDALHKTLYKSNKKQTSKLIKEIAKICEDKRGRDSTRTKAKVKKIITYNFDDLIEEQLTMEKVNHTSIYANYEMLPNDSLPVFHVHGYIPKDIEKFKASYDSELVFSEKGYHHVYNTPFHWSNIEQINSFRNSICVMIGLSLNDPNIRRLLDVSMSEQEEPKHFAFMKKSSLKSFTKGLKKKDKDVAKLFLKEHHNLIKQSLNDLGVKVIWYKDHDDLPDLLRDVFDSSNKT